MEIIDSHLHYWEPASAEHPYAGGVDLGPPYSVEQMLAEAQGAGITRLVQVTPSCMGFDNDYAFESAQRHPQKVAGVFARFDPFAVEMPQRLERLRRTPRFLGIRLTLFGEMTAWLDDRKLDPLFAAAGELGVPVAVYAPHAAAALASVARRHPKLRLLVDHMALHWRGNDTFATWPQTIAMAGVPNIWIKVSSFPEFSGEPYPFKNMQPLVKEVFERFGPDRMIWGSNFPPSKKACPLKQSVDFMLHECSFLTDGDREKIFGKTLLAAIGAA